MWVNTELKVCHKLTSDTPSSQKEEDELAELSINEYNLMACNQFMNKLF